jgi:hypothetical protein
MMDKLVDLLTLGTDPEVRKEVVWLLGNLAASDDEKRVNRDHPGVLDGLVALVSRRDAEIDTQRYPTPYTVRRQTLKGDSNSKLPQIAGVTESLVNLLFDFEKADVQMEALHYLSFLAYSEENRVVVATFPGVSDGLASAPRSNEAIEDLVWRLKTSYGDRRQILLDFRNRNGTE